MRLCGADGQEIGRGLSNYTAEEVRQIQGLNAEEIGARLGHLAYKGVIHRDNLTVTAHPV